MLAESCVKLANFTSNILFLYLITEEASEEERHKVVRKTGPEWGGGGNEKSRGMDVSGRAENTGLRLVVVFPNPSSHHSKGTEGGKNCSGSFVDLRGDNLQAKGIY